MHTDGGRVWARYSSQVPILSAQLHYTSDTGPWQKRSWQSVPAKLDDSVVRAELPAQRPVVYYLSITDKRQALVSTPHATLPQP